MKNFYQEAKPLLGFKGWILLILAACLVFTVGFIGIFLFSTSNLAGECGNDVLQKIPSPDGKYVAVIFERSCGATTGYTTEVSVLPVTANLPDERGNAFWWDRSIKLNVDWTENRTLKVIVTNLPENYPENFQVGDVQIIYKTN